MFANFFTISTLFYPYAIFVHDKFIKFIGVNELFTTVTYVFFPVKIFTMIVCWGISIWIALIGMFVLYFYNKKYELVAIEGREHFPKSGNRSLDKKCGENKRQEQFVGFEMKQKIARMSKKFPLSGREKYEKQKQNKGNPVVIRRRR